MVAAALTALLAACGEHAGPSAVNGPAPVAGTRVAPVANPNRPGTTVIVYDNFQKSGGYTLADYSAKWTIDRGRSLTETAARIPIPAGVPSALLANRPDVRSAAASLRAATARVGVADAARLPTFTLTGQYGAQSGELSRWFASGSTIWQAFVGVSIPLFQDGRPGGEGANIARARAAQARSRYEQTVLAALRETEDALVALRSARDRTAEQERQSSRCAGRSNSRTCAIRAACRVTSTCSTPSGASSAPNSR